MCGARRRGAGLPLGLLLALAACAADDARTAGPPGHRPRHWSYADKAQWASDFPDCGGHMQSPINIDTATTLYGPQLKAFHLSGYNLPPEKNLSLRNNGHTTALPATSLNLSGRRLAKLSLACLPTCLCPEVDSCRPTGLPSCICTGGPTSSLALSTPWTATATLGRFMWSITTPTLAASRRQRESPGAWLCWLPFSRLGQRKMRLISTSLNIWTRSMRKISMLEETLLGGKEELIQDNFRLPQSLHDRQVLASFLMPPAPAVPEPSDAGKQVGSSLHTGDLLAILFGTLFGVTAIAFFLYARKHRRQHQRLDAQAAKPSVIYMPATAEEHTG